jgi:hypothetical protein
LRWNGSSWAPFTSPTSMSLLEVAMASPDVGWAVGARGTQLRWNGQEWASHGSCQKSYLPLALRAE